MRVRCGRLTKTSSVSAELVLIVVGAAVLVWSPNRSARAFFFASISVADRAGEEAVGVDGVVEIIPNLSARFFRSSESAETCREWKF
jgi:hypothetical protein